MSLSLSLSLSLALFLARSLCHKHHHCFVHALGMFMALDWRVGLRLGQEVISMRQRLHHLRQVCTNTAEVEASLNKTTILQFSRRSTTLFSDHRTTLTSFLAKVLFGRIIQKNCTVACQASCSITLNLCIWNSPKSMTPLWIWCSVYKNDHCRRFDQRRNKHVDTGLLFQEKNTDMSQSGHGGPLKKRFNGDGNAGAAEYKVWKRWARAAIAVKKAAGMSPWALGPWIYTLPHDQAAVALGSIENWGHVHGRRR